MIRRAALVALAAACLPLEAHAQEPRAVLLVTAGEGVSAASLEVVRSTVADLIDDSGYDLVHVEGTGEPAALLAKLQASLLVTLHLEAEDEEIRIDIAIHDLAGHVQEASNAASMSAVLAKSVKLLLDILPAPGSLPPPPVEKPAEAGVEDAVPLAVHEHHHSSPCSGQSCSGHGRCVEVQGQPACACDEGYAPDTATGLSCQSAIYEPPLPADQSVKYWGRARRLAIAGFVLDSLGLASLTGGWLFTGLACGWYPFCTIIGFIPAAALMHGIAGPLKLHGLTIANKYAGRKPVDGLVIAGWISYSLTLASLVPMPFSPLIDSDEIFIAVPILYTVLHIVSTVISFVAGGRALRMSSAAREQAESAALVPYAAPVPGGLTIGLAGSF